VQKLVRHNLKLGDVRGH